LIVERPGKSDLLLEIKSTDFVKDDDTKSLEKIAKDWDRQAKAILISNDTLDKTQGTVHCVHWTRMNKLL
jgi:hypothetical protein